MNKKQKMQGNAKRRSINKHKCKQMLMYTNWGSKSRKCTAPAKGFPINNAKMYRNAKRGLINNQQNDGEWTNKNAEKRKRIAYWANKSNNFHNQLQCVQQNAKTQRNAKELLNVQLKVQERSQTEKVVQQTSKNAEKCERSAYKQPSKGWPRNKLTRRETLNEWL